MSSAQFQGLAREIIFAILAAVVAFNLLPESHVATIGAAVLAAVVLVWGIIVKPTDGTSIGSLVRKLIQTIAPALTLFEVVSPEQGSTLAAIALGIVSFWSVKANSTLPPTE